MLAYATSQVYIFHLRSIYIFAKNHSFLADYYLTNYYSVFQR